MSSSLRTMRHAFAPPAKDSFLITKREEELGAIHAPGMNLCVWELINEIEDLDAANRAIVPDAQAIRRASAGHVVLLKGELYPGNAGNGAVHRSPPIAEAGERRLVLTLDASAAP